MKKIFKYLAAAITGTTLFVACSVEDRTFDDASEVYFTDTEVTRAVSSTVIYTDVDIPYNLTSAAEGSHTVNLVFDPNFSTAAPSTDFQILSGDEITAGEVGGVLKLRIFSGPASSEGKIANFKISSPTLKNFKDYSSVKVTLIKTCPISTFVGSFSNTMGWWNPGQVVDVVADPSTPNKLIVQDFFGGGLDLPLTYDPVSYTVTVPNMQTNDTYGTYGLISIRPATDGSRSSFNSCTRTVRLFVNYYVAAGSIGNFEERFIGN